MSYTPVLNQSLLTPQDIIQIQQGTHYSLYKKMGSILGNINGRSGRYFTVWAPTAIAVSVIGDFNDWSGGEHPLFLRDDQSGIWQGFIADCKDGQMYKFQITSKAGIVIDKGDPFANEWELRPKTASVLSDLSYQWKDSDWMGQQKMANSIEAPWIVYEVHLLSWMRPNPHDENSFNTYLQLIDLLVPYVQSMGFTHVEFMPVMEHPNDASWGYQGTGFFAPTSRFGSPVEFMQLIDAFHQAGVGVILDWVPSHFPYDAHGLYMFDGSHVYEYSDMRKGYHPDWHSYIFDYGKPEVKSFLTSSARFWLDVFHADGLRVDGVSSILILSYSRAPGQWEPNAQGGDSNLEAIKFLQDLNESVCKDFPGVQVIAEESTAWQGVTRKPSDQGLGFGMKWMMGWMHDSLEYFQLNDRDRQNADRLKKFKLSMEYFYSEHFMLALSHDEVVYGKKPLLLKMPGDEVDQFKQLRLLYLYMFTHPGAKLLFMGDEFGSNEEWNFKSELPWRLLEQSSHHMLQAFVRALCALVRTEPALHENQFNSRGFEWISTDEPNTPVVAYWRKGKLRKNDLLVALNLSSHHFQDVRLPIKGNSKWCVLFDSAGPENESENASQVIQITAKSNDIALRPLHGVILKAFD